MDVEGLKGAVEIVGIVGDVHDLGITSEITSEIYLSYSQAPPPIICFAIRTVGDPYSVAKVAERAIWAVDRDQAVGFVMSMIQLSSESLAPQRAIMLLLAPSGALAMLMP